ncbi:protein POLLEN DEFECTIVE IN GUIDANCE 1 isoform X2 [Coffea eugenioides]|uniref:protein POLLEN DEFECTIVE IN GUIDANCE 1 isoform X2 n=1 Tax=Coffea eugenioides TaxID=49369 RepID=UPI000F611D91|nr:protein POLLEN DEFECTIVE IN GUIDANCE 1 isoform X2 [Coffea eugenioides]
MPLKSSQRKLSFSTLTTLEAQSDDVTSIPRFISDPSASSSTVGDGAVLDHKKRKKRKKIKKSGNDKVADRDGEAIDRGPGFLLDKYSCTVVETYPKVVPAAEEPERRGRDCSVRTVHHSPHLRQRNVSFVAEEVTSGVTSLGSEVEGNCNGDKHNGGEIESKSFKEDEAESKLQEQQHQKPTVEMNGRKLEKEESLDWKKLMAEDPNQAYPLEKSPMKYFLEEMYAGNSLRSTITPGNEKDRERVYDTIFRLPWRCELLIDVGFFVCFDSFLSLLTIMPARITMMLYRLLKTRQFKRLSAAELSDIGCFIVLAIGVSLLQLADISWIYHMIRGQGTIKLYVVYNVLEIFDRLCQSFGGDVMQTLFNTADGLANCSVESMQEWQWRFIKDEALAVSASIVHSFILLAQGITLSTCIVAHNNALFALLVSNNFAEIKSNVFKRFSKDNIHNLTYFDAVERFHISAFLLFVLAQNILEAEGHWFKSFLYTLKIQTESGKRSLVFVPLAPACLVIRVLRPVYAAHLPFSPFLWRLFWILLLAAMTFVMLSSLKLLVGMGLQKHAWWYIRRCDSRRKLHKD